MVVITKFSCRCSHRRIHQLLVSCWSATNQPQGSPRPKGDHCRLLDVFGPLVASFCARWDWISHVNLVLGGKPPFVFVQKWCTRKLVVLLQIMAMSGYELGWLKDTTIDEQTHLDGSSSPRWGLCPCCCALTNNSLPFLGQEYFTSRYFAIALLIVPRFLLNRRCERHFVA